MRFQILGLAQFLFCLAASDWIVHGKGKRFAGF